MKKNKYFEFKVKISKKLVSLLTVLSVFTIGAVTAFASFNEIYKPNEAPVITAESGIYMKGEEYDLDKIAIATDKEDGDITSKITYKVYSLYGTPSKWEWKYLGDDNDSFNTDRNHTYRIVFSVTDSYGQTTTTESGYVVFGNGSKTAFDPSYPSIN